MGSKALRWLYILVFSMGLLFGYALRHLVTVREASASMIETISENQNENQECLNLSEHEIKCLAENIYFEAGVESYEGKLAIAQVTFNRLMTGRWGDTICDVVHSPYQFSWTNDKKEPPSGRLWLESKQVASDFINGARMNDMKDVLFYHANYIDPRWNRKYIVAKIDSHIFYSEYQKL